MNIVVLDAFTANPGDLSWDGLKKLGKLTLYDRTPATDVIERSNNAEIILTNKVVINQQVIDALPRLKYIGVLATGTNNVDLKYARSKGIVVANIPKYSTESVVQTVFAHILNLASLISQNTTAVREGDWVSSPDFTFTKGKLTELYGKRLGIVGLGAIGKRVAQVAAAFGMNVIAYGPHLSIGGQYGDVKAVSLDQLFQTSDVVSLHCPLTDATRNLINKERLSTIKDGMLLINTGRGPLLNEQDVAEALQSGKLGGLGVDVLSTEPPKADNPLLSAPNCYITPHCAWASYEARNRLIQIAVDNLSAFLANKPVNVVN